MGVCGSATATVTASVAKAPRAPTSATMARVRPPCGKRYTGSAGAASGTGANGEEIVVDARASVVYGGYNPCASGASERAGGGTGGTGTEMGMRV